MALQGWLQIGLTFLLGLLISMPVGRYLARVVTDRKTPLDRLLDPIDNFIYLVIGTCLDETGRALGQAFDDTRGLPIRPGAKWIVALDLQQLGSPIEHCRDLGILNRHDQASLLNRRAPAIRNGRNAGQSRREVVGAP